MIKRVILGLIIATILSVLCNSIYNKLNEQSFVNLSPIPFFPSEPSSFFRFKDFSKTLRHFSETNMLWSAWTNQDSNGISFLNRVNVVLNDSLFSSLFGNGDVFLGLYQKDSIQSWLMVKNIIKDVDISNIGNSIQFEFCENTALIPPFLICSSSEFLLESFKKNMNSPRDSLTKTEFAKNLKFSTSSSPLSFSVNLSNEPNEVKRFFQADEWIQMDLEYNSNEIKLSGVSHEKNKSQLLKPRFSNFPFLKDLKIDLFEEVVILPDSLLFLEDNKVFSRINLVDNVQFKSYDIILMDALPTAYLNSFLISDSTGIPFDLNEYALPLDNTPFPALLSTYFNTYDFGKKELSQVNDFYIISTASGKREFLYQLKKMDQKKDNYIDYNTKAELNHPFSYHLLANKSEIIKRIDIENSNIISPSLIDFCGGLNWKLNRYDDRIYYSAVLLKNEKEKKDKRVLWSLNLDQLIWGPYALKNHRTDSRDIVVQDSANKIHYIGANGNIKWSKALDGRILGKPFQIDAFQNNKFQFLFNTEKSIYALDILGNSLESFPIKLPFKATNEVVALDYDQNNNYRFLIALEDNRIYNYDVLGNLVGGWEKPLVNSPIHQPISHFAINGLDYIFTIQDSGVVNLYNRKGQLRLRLKAKIDIPLGSDYFIEKSFNIDSSSITFENTLGGVSKYVFSSDKPIVLNDTTKQQALKTTLHLSNNRTLFHCQKSENTLKIVLNGNQEYNYNIDYPFEILSANGNRNFVPVFNSKTKEMQLINNKFYLSPDYYRSSDQFCISDINRDEIDELVTILDKELLICYQIRTTNNSSN